MVDAVKLACERADVRCIDSCVSPQNPPRYAPVTAGAHWRGKILASPTDNTFIFGDNSAGKAGWTPPCPPKGG